MVFFSEELEIFEVEDYDRSVIISEFLQLSPTGKQLAMLEVDFFKCNEMAVHPESTKNTKFYHLRNQNIRIPNSPRARMRRSVPIKSKLNRQLVTMRNNKTTKDTKNITNTTNASTSSESERSDDKDQEEIETKTV